MVRKREFDNGLTGISPLGPLCNCEEFERERENKYERGEHAGIEFAPTILKEYSSRWLLQNANSSNTCTPSQDETNRNQHAHPNPIQALATMPPLLLLHGKDDTVAPPLQSQILYDIVKEKKTKDDIGMKFKCQIDFLEGLEHRDVVVDVVCVGSAFTNSKVDMNTRTKMNTQQKLFHWLDEIL